MWIKIQALFCCIIATSFAADEPRPKKKDDDNRGKRNLEYSIAHHFAFPNYSAERRISTGFQIPQVPHYPFYFPIEKTYFSIRKNRPSLSTPPYAVQMEPLIHYSQRDPLYESNSLTFIGDATNEIRAKEDLVREHSHNNRVLYGQPEPAKHIVERPIYIKEPEPIIEIIIKESNVTLPPLPTPPVTIAPKKKEQVQVFYVKYKKNTDGYGKDTIVYDKPIPAISPNVPDEPAQVEPPVIKYEVPISVTLPTPSTTLRAIVKPDSESYHSNKGIHITFGKQENEQYKRSNDDDKEESAPEPAISHPQATSTALRPQGRQFQSHQDRPFNLQSSFFPKRPPTAPTYNYQNIPPNSNQNNSPSNFNTDRFPSQVRQFNQPPPPFKQQSPFGRQFPPPLQQFQQLPSLRPPSNFQNNAFQQRPTSPTFTPQQPNNFQSHFNQPLPPRQPVPYKPFENLRNQQQPTSTQSQITFPRPHTHFPVNQQHSSFSTNNNNNQQQQSFHSNFNSDSKYFSSSQQQFQNNVRHEEPTRQPQFQFNQNSHSQQSQQFPRQPQFPQHQQQQFSQQKPQSSFPQQKQPQFPQQQQSQFPQQQQSQFPQQKQSQFPQQQQSQFPQQQQSQFTQQQQVQFPQSQQSPFLQQKQAQFPQPQQSQFQFSQQQRNQQQFSINNSAQPERLIPPGGELIQSLPKYEQHISIPAGSKQPQSQALHQSQIIPQQQQLQQYQNSHSEKLQQQQTQYQGQQRQNQQSFSINQSQQQLNSPSNTDNNQQLNLQIQQQFKQPVTQSSQIFHNQSPQTNFVSSTAQNQNKNIQNIYIQQQRSTQKPIVQVSTISYQVPSSTTPSTTTTTEKSKQSETKLTEKDLKELNIELPDEVPEELRQQLLSSGILKNAQISVLDYDKVGDIPISALPPDQLANFYSAGGGQQIASGSENVPTVVKINGEPVKDIATDDLEMEGSESEISEVREEPPIEMKVVHYDPQTEDGKAVQKAYIQERATQVDPVNLDDQQYNRYLPVKVNGAAFPIPNVPELQGRNITSVVVLAPVDLNTQEKTRVARDVQQTNKNSRSLAAEALKVLIDSPTTENYKDWLTKENATDPDKQAVILLVTGDAKRPSAEKEIFMYDLATQTVNKLSGELSSAFVDAAETNSQSSPPIAAASSNIVETRIPYPENANGDKKNEESESSADLVHAASEYTETKFPLIDPTVNDQLPAASEQLESFVDISGMSVQPQADLAVAASNSDTLAKFRK